ncbi:SGNH/GDSL hydrolase family protein [Agromyces sp. Soil535]|uniref:SGNH/GDSL hydrolase family protein n=1 Tax=Agromyces sp. Soil535 TaxID=1736390 RepID=UPI0009EAC9F9|nr:SGNH/GDSL hydrolase family protein [Agromyces sp. Soil535]
MSSRVLRVSIVVAALAATGIAAPVGWRRFRARLAANSLVLNETLPVHSKWWRDHAKLEGELLYVAIGDSAAQGIGASRPDRSYVGVLADEIRSVTGCTVRVVNLSVSGATVDLAVQDQLPRFVKLRPDIMTVAIGANDIAGWDPAAFERGIRTTYAALPQHALVADLPFFYFPHNERRVAVANRIVRRVAAEHGLTVVPLHATTKHQGISGILTQFAIDLFHPNDHGYRVWADAFGPSLAAQLVERFMVPEVTTADLTAPDVTAQDVAASDVGGRG